MKSTMLAIVFTMFMSALYSFQNLDVIKVRFFMFEGSFPQGVWGIALFCAGVVLMWIFSLFAGLETRGKYKKMLKEREGELNVAQQKAQELSAELFELKKSCATQACVNNTQKAEQSVATDVFASNAGEKKV